MANKNATTILTILECVNSALARGDIDSARDLLAGIEVVAMAMIHDDQEHWKQN